MPLQNRVLPSQEIVASPGRGLLMGNRGSLHDAGRRLGTTRWRSKAWLCCIANELNHTVAGSTRRPPYWANCLTAR